MFILFYFAVHYAPGPFTSLFGSVRGMDENVHFKFQREATLFSNGSTPERNAFILAGHERTLRVIIFTAVLEGENRIVYRKSEFILGDAAPDTDQQLLAGEGQSVYTLDGDRYYLPQSKRHYSLAFFQSS